MAAHVVDTIEVPDIDQRSDDGVSSCGDASPPVRCILMTFGQKDSAPALRKQEQILLKRFKWLIDTGCGYDLISVRDAQKLGLKICTVSPLAFETAGGIDFNTLVMFRKRSNDR